MTAPVFFYLESRFSSRWDRISLQLNLYFLGQVLGATWFRRGLQSSAGRAEVLDPRKTARKKLNANDERFALAA